MFCSISYKQSEHGLIVEAILVPTSFEVTRRGDFLRGGTNVMPRETKCSDLLVRMVSFLKCFRAALVRREECVGCKGHVKNGDIFVLVAIS